MYSLQITRRGAAPGGGGEVHFRCPVRQKLRPIQLKDPGKIKRIRGESEPIQNVCCNINCQIKL